MLGNNIKKVVGQAGDDAIASYDFYDLASGRGSKTLYCGDVNSFGVYSGATATPPTYKMSPVQWYSDQGWIQSGAGWTTIPFEMELNKPITLDGYGLVSIPKIERNVVTNPFTVPSWVFASLYKVSGGTPTFIASGGSFYQKSIAQDAAVYHIHEVGLDIPVTTLRRGDSLRLEIKYSGATGFCIIGCDPYGRTSSTEIYDGGGTTSWGTTTALTFNMPLRIDI